MVKLTKKYPIVYKDKDLILPLTEEGVNGEVYPGKGTEYAEFDTYEEAQNFIKENNLIEQDYSTDSSLEN